MFKNLVLSLQTMKTWTILIQQLTIEQSKAQAIESIVNGSAKIAFKKFVEIYG